MSESFPESRMFRSLEKNELVEASELVIKNSLMKKIEIQDFSDVYDQKDVERDQDYVEHFDRRIDEELTHLSEEERQKIREGKMISEAFEVIVTEGIQHYLWFGENAQTVRTSKYDDRYNGIDAVVEYDEGKKEPERIALAIDASMNPDFAKVEYKIKRNVAKLKGERQLARVKYFESATTGKKSALEGVIPVVVGLEGKNADELITLAAHMIRQRDLKAGKNESQKIRDLAAQKLKDNTEQMKIHPAQQVMLEQIKVQLLMYQDILTNETAPLRTVTMERIATILQIIERVIGTKKSINKDLLENDQINTAIHAIAKKE